MDDPSNKNNMHEGGAVYTPDKKTGKPVVPENSDYDDAQLVYKCKTLEKQSLAHRRKFDWEWLVRSLYVRGYHFANYNRGTNTILFASRTGVKIPINLVGAHLRGVRNQVTSFQPKWEVLPNFTTSAAFDNARYSGKTLDYIYEKAQIKRKIKEAVNDSLMYSIGIWMFDINQKGEVVVFRVDPFDFFCDPNVKSPNINDPDYGAEYVVIANQMPVDAIQKNKDFNENRLNIQTDNLVAAAEYKRFLLQVTKNAFSAQKEFNQTVIVKTAYLRERQNDGSIKIRQVVYTENDDRPLLNKLLDTDEYPFEVLRGDITPGDLYSEAWIKHLIPINRVIDALESHIFEYNHFFARGKWIIDKNSGVKLITNQHGQIIEKNRGSQVQPITVPPLPPSPQEQISNMRKYLEDISGVHDVSLGRLPGTIRSGSAIAELRQSDATNQSDLVDNLEDFLSRAGRKILRLVAENWTTSKLITVTGIGGKPEYFMAVGEDSPLSKSKNGKKVKSGDKELPLAVIGKENDVRVQIGSWLAYTKEARMEKLKELFRLGAIDQRSFLNHLEFADTDGIIQRTREEQTYQQYAGKKSEQVQKEYGIQLDEESLAMAENELMLEGTEQHAEAQDDHEIHMLVHKEQGENKLVLAHIKEHERFDKWQKKMQLNPIMPNESMEAPIPPGMPMGPEVPGASPEVPPFMMGAPIGPGAPPLPPGEIPGVPGL